MTFNVEAEAKKIQITWNGKLLISNDGHIIPEDAAREIYKYGLGLVNNGYMYIVDGDDSYQQETMEEEAVWGYELDKRTVRRDTAGS